MLINFEKKYVVLRNPKCASFLIWEFIKRFDKDAIDFINKDIIIDGKNYKNFHPNLSIIKRYLKDKR